MSKSRDDRDMAAMFALPEANELAIVLKEVVVPTGLVIAHLQEQIENLGSLTRLAVVRDHEADGDPQAQARAVRAVIVAAVQRTEGESRAAAELLLGITSTRGQSRAQRRRRAADELGRNVDYFKRRLELELLTIIADEIVEIECQHQVPALPDEALEVDGPGATSSRWRTAVVVCVLAIAALVMVIGARRGPSGSRALSTAAIAMIEPQGGADAQCRRNVAIYHCPVTGRVVGLGEDEELLLWVRPVQPPSERAGWYLQRPPFNGVGGIDDAGTWTGTIQIGNADFPPHDADLFDLAVTVATHQAAAELEARPEVVVELQPVGRAMVTARRVRVSLVNLTH